MNILITGATGFIGTELCSVLQRNGHLLTILTRSITHAKTVIQGDKTRFITHLNEISATDIFHVVINLAGAPIDKRWTNDYKTIIQNSRILLTRELVATLARLKHRPGVLISGSAIGFYGPQQDNPLTEDSAGIDSFSHRLCVAWEEAANEGSQLGIRVCLIRTGIVLGKNGGIYKKLRLPFSLGLGGPMGSGQQWMSWIARCDWIRIIQFCIENSSTEGPLNATAPHPVTNEEFTQTFAHSLHRPAFFRVPAPLLKFGLGEMAQELLLSGQKVLPKHLTQAQFVFKYPTLSEALAHQN